MRKLVIVTLFLSLGVAHAQSRQEASAAYERGDYAKAMELYLPLAEAGDGNALGNVGNMYAFGWGVPVDQAKAAEYWFKAAEKHVGTAMGNIANCYKAGTCGLKQDDALAAQWWKRAAEHRHAPSMLNLSTIYMNGDGLERDRVKGLAWASLAASNSASPQITEAATQQTKHIMSESTKEEIDAAIKYSNELIALIDANVAMYKSQ